jgi:hypothetical protein
MLHIYYVPDQMSYYNSLLAETYTIGTKIVSCHTITILSDFLLGNSSSLWIFTLLWVISWKNSSHLCNMRAAAAQYSACLRAGKLSGPSSSPSRVKNSLISILSRLALGSTQPPILWVPVALSSRLMRPVCEATTHLQLMLRSRKYTSIDPLSHIYIYSWCSG